MVQSDKRAIGKLEACNTDNKEFVMCWDPHAVLIMTCRGIYILNQMRRITIRCDTYTRYSQPISVCFTMLLKSCSLP